MNNMENSVDKVKSIQYNMAEIQINSGGKVKTKLEVKIAQNGMKQRFISGKIGVHESTLSRYVAGMRMPPEVLMRLSTFFDCDPEELIGYAEEVIG
ncbi:MAG TPA: helix-turn-helix transcriptional regulator, partial [bacterium]|nr:helix-turn-helix transcriptional regulator [bacterium]